MNPQDDDPPRVNYQVLPPDPRLKNWPYPPDGESYPMLFYRGWIPIEFNAWVRRSASFAE